MKSKAYSKPKKATFLCVNDPFTSECSSKHCGGSCESSKKIQDADISKEDGNEVHKIAEPVLGQGEEYNGFSVLSCREFGSSPDKLRENLDGALRVFIRRIS